MSYTCLKFKLQSLSIKMQTRKSGIPTQQTGSLWQATTLSAISRQQKLHSAGPKHLGVSSASKQQPQQQNKQPFITQSASQATLGSAVDSSYSGEKKLLKPYFQYAKSPVGNKISSGLMQLENAMTPQHVYTSVKRREENEKVGSVRLTPAQKSGSKDISQQNKGSLHILNSETLRIQKPKGTQMVTGSGDSASREYGTTRQKKSRREQLTQQQTHSGSGAQQNLYIKNLFLIQSGTRNPTGLLNDPSFNSSQTCKNEGSSGGDGGGFSDLQQQNFETAPSVYRRAYDDSDVQKLNSRRMIPMRNESQGKAIEIATSVLQHLAPLTGVTSGKPNQLRLSNDKESLQTTLRVGAMQQTKKSPSKSISPEKSRINRVQKTNQPYENSPDESETHSGNNHHQYLLGFEKSTTKEISLFGANCSDKKSNASYGEMPKYSKGGQDVIINNKKSMHKAQEVLSQERRKPQGQGTSGSAVRQGIVGGAGEVFNYKMKSNHKGAGARNDKSNTKIQTQPRKYEMNHSNTVQLDLLSDRESQNHKASQRQHLIAKSQSEQQFLSMKKQPSADNDYGSKNDAMYLSIGNISMRQQSLRQGENHLEISKQFEYEDKQSEELSQFTERGFDKQSIKVMARFRPLNSIEKEINEIYPKPDIVSFMDDDKTVRLIEEFHVQNSSNMTFTFDHIFSPGTSQSQVFDMVGSQMIEDIMQGYNGTIFAYGQTGSGKTFTMYGEDIFDENLKGIVPRAARQIFDHIREQEIEVEYSIRVQMIEIYKETLRDLLHNSNDRGPAPELKIKEDPKRGTYVEGLSDACIVNEEEIMSVICTGETMRHVASTQLNQVSSRSHSICVIEVIQKYPNDSERRGVLNLVDLAGSERVSRSMAQGSALEEAKKINFSLSMLGKVISCLTKNTPHIPYRDSKLTRLLKESLGGNNKTSLIVACSMHHSNFEETLSSLRFASSAKFIQNKVKLNIKTSTDHLHVIIEQLKFELRSAKEEIYRLRLTSSNQSQHQQHNLDGSLISSKTDDEASIIKPPLLIQQNSIVHSQSSVIGATPLQAIHNLPHQSLASKNYDVIETNNQQQISLVVQQEVSQLKTMLTEPSKHLAQVHLPQCGDSHHQNLIAQLAQHNEQLEMKLQSKESELDALLFQKDELQVKIGTLEDKLDSYKKKLLMLEKKINENEGEKDFFYGKEVTQSHKMRHLENQVVVLNDQVKCLETTLIQSERKAASLALQNQEVAQNKIAQILTNALKMMKNPATIEIQDAKKMSEGQHKAMEKNLYTLEQLKGLEEDQKSPEVIMYMLKKMLLEASIANHNFQRTVSTMKWQHQLDVSRLKVKTDLCSSQEATIGTLEDILERMRRTHDKLKIRVDKLETNFTSKAQQQDYILQTDHMSNGGSIGEALTMKANGFETMSRSATQFMQSMVSNQGACGGAFLNSKSRFTKPISSRTIKRMFTSKGETPGSRASITGACTHCFNSNQSIIQQYYGLKQTGFFTLQKAKQLSQIDSNTVGGRSVTHSSGGPFLPTESVENLAKEEEQNQVLQTVMSHPGLLNDDSEIPFSDKLASQQHITKADLDLIDQSTDLKEIKQYLKERFSGGQAGSNGHNKEEEKAEEDQNQRLQTLISAESPLEKTKEGEEEQDDEVVDLCRGADTLSETSEIQRENDLLSKTEDRGGQFPETKQLRYRKFSSRLGGGTCDAQMLRNGDNSLVMGGSLPFNLTQAMQSHQLLPQSEIIDRLQDKVIMLQEELDTQRNRGDELKKVCQQNRLQIEAMKKLIDEKDLQFTEMMKEEMLRQDQTLKQFKALNEAEIYRKQREIEKLHELLAKWIESYQVLEIRYRGGSHVQSSSDLDDLLAETMRHRQSRSNNLDEIMLTVTPGGNQPLLQSFNNFKPLQSRVLKQLENQKSIFKSPRKMDSLSVVMQTDSSMKESGRQVKMTRISKNHSSTSHLKNSSNHQPKIQFDSANFKGDTSPVHHQHCSFEEDREELDEGEEMNGSCCSDDVINGIGSRNQSLLERLPLESVGGSSYSKTPMKETQNEEISLFNLRSSEKRQLF